MSIRIAFQFAQRSARQEQGNCSKDAKAAIDQLPSEGDSAKVAGYQRERNDSCACHQTEGQQPSVLQRISIRADKGKGDDQMSVSQPVRPIGEKRILHAGVSERMIDTRDPRKQMGRGRQGNQRRRLQQLKEPMYLCLEWKSGDATEDEPDDEDQNPESNAAKRRMRFHGRSQSIGRGESYGKQLAAADGQGVDMCFRAEPDSAKRLSADTNLIDHNIAWGEEFSTLGTEL